MGDFMSDIPSKLDSVFTQLPDTYTTLRYNYFQDKCFICDHEEYNILPIITFNDIIDNRISSIKHLDEFWANNNNLDSNSDSHIFYTNIDFETMKTIIAVAMLFGFPVSPKIISHHNIGATRSDIYVSIVYRSVIINVGEWPILLSSVGSDDISFELHTFYTFLCRFQIFDNEFINYLKSELWRCYRSYCK